ncbi:MAG: methyltransferase domain-containing protein [Planctomycetota bacterium]
MPAHLSRLYTERACDYDKLFGRMFAGFHRWAAGRLHCSNGRHVLDVGVGTGLALPFYPTDTRIVGVDISESMLVQARRRIRRKRLTNVELAQMDGTALAFQENAFDAVVCTFAVSVVSDPRKLVREMSRVARPGAQVILLNHFCPRSLALRLAARSLNPVCLRLGWHTALTMDELLGGTPLRVVRVDSPLRLPVWKMVEASNDK